MEETTQQRMLEEAGFRGIVAIGATAAVALLAIHLSRSPSTEDVHAGEHPADPAAVQLLATGEDDTWHPLEARLPRLCDLL